jgi:DNA-binding beta-propeller fold protein YncE
MKVGSGNHRYEVIDGWAKLPPSISLGYTHGIVVDSKNQVYLFHTGKPSLVKFDEEGNYISSWGDQFEGGAHGCYLHQEDDGEYLYVTDTTRGLMVKLTLDGQELLTIETPDLPDIYYGENKFIPTDVAVASNGDIYIADGYGQSYIHQYTSKGQYIRSWGGVGQKEGQLQCPHGISIDTRGSEPVLYVADRGNNRIQVFTLDGQHIKFITNDMDLPDSFYYSGDEMFIPDLHSRVTIFDKNNQLITHLGEDQQAYKQEGWPNLPKSYYRPDRFSSPHGVCVDSKGNVYVAEWIIDGRVTKLIRD